MLQTNHFHSNQKTLFLPVGSKQIHHCHTDYETTRTRVKLLEYL